MQELVDTHFLADYNGLSSASVNASSNLTLACNWPAAEMQSTIDPCQRVQVLVTTQNHYMRQHVTGAHLQLV